MPDFSLSPEIYITNSSAYLMVQSDTTTTENYTGTLVVSGSAIPISDATSSASSFLQVQTSQDTFTADFTYTQTPDQYTFTITPTTNVTFSQLEDFLLGSALGVQTNTNGFFPNETIFTAIDLTQFTITNPAIYVVSLPNPVYYVIGTATSDSNTATATVALLTTNVGGYQNSFLYLNFTEGTLDLLAENILQSDTDSSALSK